MFDTIPILCSKEDEPSKAFFTFIGNNSFLQHRVSDADYSSEQVQTFFTFLESQGFPTDLIVRNLLEYLIENHAPQFINILHRIPKGGSRDKFNYMLNATQFYIEHFDSKQDEA